MVFITVTPKKYQNGCGFLGLESVHKSFHYIPVSGVIGNLCDWETAGFSGLGRAYYAKWRELTATFREQGNRIKDMDMLFIKEKQLANGSTLSFYDCSKRLVTDRWFVKMRGEVKFPVAGAAWPDFEGDGPELVAMVKERLGDSVTLILDRERNFIDAEVKEAVVSQLIDQIEENLVGYLSDPSFPQKLFARRYDEMRQQCLLERQLPQPPVDDEDNSPADFSACFRT